MEPFVLHLPKPFRYMNSDLHSRTKSTNKERVPLCLSLSLSLFLGNNMERKVTMGGREREKLGWLRDRDFKGSERKMRLRSSYKENDGMFTHIRLHHAHTNMHPVIICLALSNKTAPTLLTTTNEKKVLDLQRYVCACQLNNR